MRKLSKVAFPLLLKKNPKGYKCKLGYFDNTGNTTSENKTGKDHKTNTQLEDRLIDKES